MSVYKQLRLGWRRRLYFEFQYLKFRYVHYAACIKNFVCRPYRDYKLKKWSQLNYPVTVHTFPKNEDVVLVRNLNTHSAGGWYISVAKATEIWGAAVIKQLHRE